MSINLFSQKIEGKVSNINGEPILNAFVYFKDSLKSTEYKEFIIVKGGLFSKKLDFQKESIFIVVNSPGYLDEYKELKNLTTEQNYYLEFELVPDQYYNLKEVILESKNQGVIIKEDTLSYKVSEFNDGSAKKIQEILQKIPGIQVNENTGDIKYNGKPIETVLLANDNLFGKNYSIGTKNINIDLVDRIEIFENYVENALLRGIDSSEKVALNLVLKKDKVDFSSQTESYGGLSEFKKMSSDINVTLLAINEVFKSFSVFSHNNVGKNNSFENYLSSRPLSLDDSENNLFAPILLGSFFGNTDFQNNRNLINNQTFKSFNFSYKLNNKINVKTNLSYTKDAISFQRESIFNYRLKNENFNTSDFYTSTQTPVFIYGELLLNFKPKNNLLIENELKFKNEDEVFNSDLVQNKQILLFSKLSNNQLFLKNRFSATNKLNDRQVIQAFVTSSYHRPQQGLDLINELGLTNYQNVNFEKKNIDFNGVLLGKYKKFKYKNVSGISSSKTLFNSFSQFNDFTILENNMHFNERKFYMESFGKLNFDKWIISSKLLFKNIYLQLNQMEEIELNRKFIFFEPQIDLVYKFNSIKSIKLNSSINNMILSPQYLFINPIFVDNRNFISNQPQLEMIKNFNTSIQFHLNNLYQQFQTNLNFNYTMSKGNIFSTIDVEENQTQIVYFYEPLDTKTFLSNLFISKYVSRLKSNFKLNSSHSFTNYYNIVNNSEVRKNDLHFFRCEFFFKTSFETKFNFENKIIWQNSFNKTSDGFTFSNNALQSRFQILYKPTKQMIFLLNHEYFRPNFNTNNDVNIYDLQYKYTNKDNKWIFNITFKNIFNTKNFESINVTDIATIVNRTNILPQYLIVGLDFNIF